MSLIKKNIKPYLIVLDNLFVHKTKDLFQFYKDNNYSSFYEEQKNINLNNLL